MKDIIIIVTIFVSIFVGGYFIDSYLDTSGNNMITKLSKLEEEINKEIMNNQDLIKNIEDYWDNEKNKWNIITNHNMVDDIEHDIMELIANYNNNDKEECLVDIKTLKNQIQDIPKGEKFNIENIL